MRLEYTKATFAAVWVLAIAGVGLVAQVGSLLGWAALTSVAVLPPIVMWWKWTSPAQSMSESIRSSIR